MVLGNEPGKENFVGDAEFRSHSSQLFPERAFAGYRKRRGRMPRHEFRERAQAHPQPLFFDEPAGLDEFPGALVRPLARPKRNVVDRYPGVLEPNFSRGTAEVDEGPA